MRYLPFLLAIPVIGISAVIQSSIISRMPLFSAKADLLLLVIVAWALYPKVDSGWFWAGTAGFAGMLISALPPGLFLIAYLLCVGLALFLKRYLWKVPLLAMLTAVILGTVIIYLVSYFVVSLQQGQLLPVNTVVNFILIPGILLNLIFAAPVYILLRDLAAWVYPAESIEV
jgi:hypothetical protein